jgi:hypothetical protein
MSEVLAAELVEDLDLYPRLRVDALHVARLAEALSAGASLPPIVVDRQSRRIVDGVHRRRAYLRVYGPAATVPVEWRDYASEAELLADALRLNAGHGRALTTAEHVRAAILAERVGLDRKTVAECLSVREQVLERLCERRIATTETGVERVVLKPAMERLAGRALDEEALAANQLLNGNRAAYFARCLVGLLRADALDRDDERLVAVLRELADLLREWLPQVATAR